MGKYHKATATAGSEVRIKKVQQRQSIDSKKRGFSTLDEISKRFPGAAKFNRRRRNKYGKKGCSYRVW